MVNITAGFQAIASPGDLRRFLEGQGDATRLRGTKDAQGNIHLYTSDKRAGLFDRMTGRAAKQRTAAREAVGLVLERHEGKATQRGLRSNVSRGFFGNIRARVNQGDTHALRSGDVVSFLKATKLVVGTLPKPVGGALAGLAAPPVGPQLSDARLSARTLRSVGEMARGLDLGDLAPGSPARGLADTLGDQIAAGFGRKSPTERQDVSLSDGAAMRGQIAKELKRFLPDATQGQRDGFARSAFERAASKLSPGQATGPDRDFEVPRSGDAPVTVTLPAVTIGGKTFAPEKYLASGGFADVFLYRADDGDTLALKMPLETSDKAVNDFGEEAKVHRTAQGAGHDNLIGLKGTVRMPDGRLAIALENASNGDVQDMGQKIRNAVGTGPGKITQDQADVLCFTVLQDMSKGLQQLRNTNLIHLDFKAPNCLIGNDGTAKISDFGLTRSGAATAAGDVLALNENVYFQSPEMAHANHAGNQHYNQANDVNMKAAMALTTGLKEQLKGMSEDDMLSIVGGVRAARNVVASEAAQAKRNEFALTSQSDVFCLGIAAYSLFTGRNMELSGSFMSHQTASLAGFLGSGKPPLSTGPDGKPVPGSLGTLTHNEDANDLINRLMDSTPGNRPDPTQLTRLDAFFGYNAAVGDKAHALLVALSKGDPSATDLASQDLQTLL